jgi:hypothetical protein
MSTIQEFNTYLINNLTKISLTKYFKKVHSKYYSNQDISFMDYFLELVDKQDEFCVNHEKLQEYKVINSIKSNDVLKCIERNQLLENIDFLTAPCGVVKERHSRGGSNGNKIEYNLKPKAFKLCLIRSINSRVYANYYLLLEEIFKYYTDYELGLKNEKIRLKNEDIKKLLNKTKKQKCKITEMSEEIKKQTNMMEKQSEQIRELLGYAKDQKVEIHELRTDVQDLTDEVEYHIEQTFDLEEKVDEVIDKVEEVREIFKSNLIDINIPPTDENKHHMFLVLQYKNEPNMLKVVRGQSRYLNKQINDDMNILINTTYNPNPVDLFVLVKDKIRELIQEERDQILEDFRQRLITLTEKKELLKDNKKNPAIKVTYNTIIINYEKINLRDVVNLINNVDKERYDKNIP